MEYLDILDNQGKFTGVKKPRTEVHTSGYWHGTVHVYVFRIDNGNLKILVHLRSADKDKNPSMWDTRFGGHIKAGDTVNDTVIKEIKEEIGIDVNLKDLIPGTEVKYDGTTDREFISVFFYNYQGDIEQLRFNDGEVQNVKWMKASEIKLESKNSPLMWTGANEEGLQKVVD